MIWLTGALQMLGNSTTVEEEMLYKCIVAKLKARLKISLEDRKRKVVRRSI